MSLPISFASNSSHRMFEFLNESNRIEGIKEVDYHKDQRFRTLEKGHFGALVDSQNLAEACKPLSVRKIKQWQGLLTREQLALDQHQHIEEAEIGSIRNASSLPKNVRVGNHVPPDYTRVPTLLDHLIEEINEKLKDQAKLADDAEYCKFLGWAFQQFESIHPFADGNGRTGRLIASYIATYCRRPIVVFNSEMIERNRYYAAHVSPEAMGKFMANKVQEVIFGMNREILFKNKHLGGATYEYRSADGKYGESYEQHALLPILYPEVENKI